MKFQIKIGIKAKQPLHCELMLTRYILQCGEGYLEEFDPKIG